MIKNKIPNIIASLLLLVMVIDVYVPDSNEQLQTTQVSAGVSGKHIQKGWSIIKKGWKSISGCTRAKSALPMTTVPVTESLFKASKVLVKDMMQIKSSEEIVPQIEKYLSETSKNQNGTKIITCVKGESNQVRMYLSQQGSNTASVDRVLSATTKSIKLAEYDIGAMREESYWGSDGLEYINFIIPRRPQFILNGKYEDRVYECMVFNIRKDDEKKWVKFKEFLYAFMNDVMNRPGQLWDEFQFYRELSKLNISERDVNEIRQYTFAQILEDSQIDKDYWDELTKFTSPKTARA